MRVKEDQNSHTGYAMPEFPGYTGPASDQCRLIRVTAVTHRKNPIMQTCIGPSEEHVSMAGIPTEASIYGMVEKAMPGKLQNVYCPSAGGGKYMAVLQFKKSVASDEGRQRQAALLAFSAFSELKHVFLVDEDVDCFDAFNVSAQFGGGEFSVHSDAQRPGLCLESADRLAPAGAALLRADSLPAGFVWAGGLKIGRKRGGEKKKIDKWSGL